MKAKILFRQGAFTMFAVAAMLSPTSASAAPADTDTTYIACGECVDGAIEAVGDMDAYVFEGSAGDSVIIRLQEQSPGHLDLKVELFDSLGVRIGDPWLDDRRIDKYLSLPYTGEYTLLVQDETGDDTGSYWLCLQCWQWPPEDRREIAYGTVVRDTIGTYVEMESYVFEGSAGDSVIVRVEEERYPYNLELKVELFDSLGVPLEDPWLDDRRIDKYLSLPYTGEYTLLVQDETGDDTGSWWLSLQCWQWALAHADTLTEREGSLTGSLDYGGLKAFRFLVARRDSTRIEMKSTELDPQMELFGPAHTLIVRVGGASSAVIGDSYFRQSGSYLVVVSDEGANHRGSYTLSWTGLLEGGLIEVTSIPVPSGVVSTGSSVEPRAVVENIGWEEQAFTAVFEMRPDYPRATLSGLSLLPGESDTIVFPPWQPPQAAAYVTRCSTYVDGNPSSGLTGVVSFTSGVGPEIHSLAPNHAVAQEGFVTVLIGGARFENGATATLERAGADTIEASVVEFISAGTLAATFDINDALEGLWDIRVRNPGAQSYVFYEGFTVERFAGRVLQFEKWEEITEEEGTFVRVGVDVPEQAGDLFVLFKKTNRIGYSGTWSGNLTLLKDGSEVAARSGQSDFDIHIQDPDAGFYTVRIEKPSYGQGLIKVCSGPDTLTLGEWHVGEVMRPYGCDWTQLDVPAGQDTLFLETEGFGLWSTLDVYHNSLANRDTTFSNRGAGYHIKGSIPSPAAGTYYLKYTDSAVMQGVSSQVREYMIIADSEPIPPPPCTTMVITDLSTYAGGTAGPVTVTISGSCLDSAATVSLVREGYEDIAATSVFGDSTMRWLKATFDLSDAQPGEWTLLAANLDGLKASAHRPFVIEPGGQPELWVDIVGRRELRVGRWQTYIVRCGNRGAVDAQSGEVVIWFPRELAAQLTTDDRLVAAQLSPSLLTPEYDADVVGYMVILRDISPGASERFYLKLRAESDIGRATIEVRTMRDFGASQYSSTVLETGAFGVSGIHGGSRRNEDATREIEGQIWCGCDSHGGDVDHAVLVLPVIVDGRVVGRQAWSEECECVDRLCLVRRNCTLESYDATSFEDELKGRGWTKCSGSLSLDEDDLTALEDKLNDMARLYHVHSEQPWKNPDANAFDCIGILEYAAEQAGINDGKGFIVEEPDDSYEGDLWRKPFHMSSCVCRACPYKGFGWPPIIQRMGLPEIRKKAKNAMESLTVQTVGSVTPEDKYGPSGFDAAGTGPDSLMRYIPPARDFSYRVEFWNHEDATAAVQEAFVVDTLDVRFQDSTLSLTGFGFLDHVVPLEGGPYFNVDVPMPESSLVVNVEGKYDPVSREISWAFRALDPVTRELPGEERPLTGFLPPITESGTEVGWVGYTIQSEAGLPTGTQLKNQAFVNFDRQPRVQPDTCYWCPAPKEGPWVNTIDAGAPQSSVLPLAEKQMRSSFLVSVSGQDDTNGSGVAYYSIYVRDRTDIDADFSKWLHSSEDSAEFIGQWGHTYEFYSVAVDNVGNRESPPTAPDAITTVAASDQTVVGPNPYVPSRGHLGITFLGPHVAGSEISVFNVAGELVATLRVVDGVDSFTWAVKSRDDHDLASGVYVWILKDPAGHEETGKFAVIR